MQSDEMHTDTIWCCV